MLTFFRRMLNSRIGIAVAGILLAVIAVSFAMSDRNNILGSAGSQAGSGERLVKIGKEGIFANDVREAMEARLDEARQQNPTIDMAGFIAGGGFESTLEGMIAQRAIDGFGRQQGLRASKKLVDGEIASISSFYGPTGQFDRSIFLRLLNDRNLTETQVREDFARVLVSRQLLGPVAAAAKVPAQLALPYASLLLETRDGTLAAILSGAMERGPDPTPAELETFYKRNIRRYTVPERRIVRFAAFGPNRFTDLKATDAELAKAYNDRKAEFAAKETRSFTQVILPSRDAAQALAAKVRAGTAMAAAASAVGLEASNSGAVEKAAFATATSPAIANAAFAAAKGAVLDPAQSGLGWNVVKVDEIATVPARTLDQVRTELAGTIEKTKIETAIADLHAKIDEAINNGSTFDEIVAANKLEVTTTPAVMANGADPDKPGETPPPGLAEVLRPAFDADVDEDPSVIPVGPATAQSFALMDVVKIIQPTPRKLEAIKAPVTNEFLLDRASKAARTAALAVIAKVNKGMTLEQALREVGRPLPPVKSIGGLRMAMMKRGQGRVEPTDALLLNMAPKSVKLLEIPGKQGWYVVYLKTIVPGDASGNPELVKQIQSSFEQAIGSEYAEQFGAAARAALGVERNEEAIAKLKRELGGEPADK